MTWSSLVTGSVDPDGGVALADALRRTSRWKTAETTNPRK
jgi:hypothetical protein